MDEQMNTDKNGRPDQGGERGASLRTLTRFAKANSHPNLLNPSTFNLKPHPWFQLNRSA
jgi:hypothetical protein